MTCKTWFAGVVLGFELRWLCAVNSNPELSPIMMASKLAQSGRPGESPPGKLPIPRKYG